MHRTGAILITTDRSVAELGFAVTDIEAKGTIVNAALRASTLGTTYLTEGVWAWHPDDASLPVNSLATELGRHWGLDRVTFHGPVLLLDGEAWCEALAPDVVGVLLDDLYELALTPLPDELPAGVLADLMAKAADPCQVVRDQLDLAGAAIESGDDDVARDIREQVTAAVLSVIATRRVDPDAHPRLARLAITAPTT